MHVRYPPLSHIQFATEALRTRVERTRFPVVETERQTQRLYYTEAE